MAESLHDFTNRGRLFPVKPGFADLMIHEIREDLRRSADLMNRMCYGDVPASVGPVQQKLPVETAQCEGYFDLEDTYLGCHRDAGHDGPHYDAHLRLEWSHR